MGAIARAPRADVLAAATIVGALAVLAGAASSGLYTAAVAPLVLAVILFATLHRTLLRWDSLVGLILVIVLFVPITKYRLPANLPFQIELYRLVVALVVFIWITSLLIDRRVRLERTAFDKPLLLIVFWALASEVANPGRVESLSTYVAKSLTFFLSFVLVYYVTASVIRKRSEAILLLKVLVLGCGVIALSSLIEHRSGFNIFYHVHSIVPFLQFQGGDVDLALRSPAGAGLCAAPDRARRRARRSNSACGVLRAHCRPPLVDRGCRLLLLAALATGSRTAIVMLIAMTVVFLFLKPRETRRIWPLLIPGVVSVHVVVPGAIGTLRNAFFPPGGIIAEQSRLGPNEDPYLAGGRIRQLGPMLREAAGYPIFGEGLGTRITGFGRNTFRNAPILDNQWLNTILELGYVGAAFWLWLFVRSVRRLCRASRESEDGDDWLFAGLAASITGFGVGMLTFDAFGFTQITFVFWILLGLSAAMLRINEEMRAEVRELAPRLRPAHEENV